MFILLPFNIFLKAFLILRIERKYIVKKQSLSLKKKLFLIHEKIVPNRKKMFAQILKKQNNNKMTLVLSGSFKVKGKYVGYVDASDPNADIDHPVTIASHKVTIRQNNRFFSYKVEDETSQPKIGVLVKVELEGDDVGWQASMVGTQEDNQIWTFNFTKIKDNRVCEFELTVTESGFAENNDEQTPRVSLLKGRRIGC